MPRSRQVAQPAQLHQNDTGVVGIPLVDDVKLIVESPGRVEFILDPAYLPESSPVGLSRVFWSTDHGCWFVTWPNGEIDGGQHHDYEQAIDHARRLDAHIRGEETAYGKWLDRHFGGDDQRIDSEEVNPMAHPALPSHIMAVDVEEHHRIITDDVVELGVVLRHPPALAATFCLLNSQGDRVYLREFASPEAALAWVGKHQMYLEVARMFPWRADTRPGLASVLDALPA